LNGDDFDTRIRKLGVPRALPQAERKRINFRVTPSVAEDFKKACLRDGRKQVQVMEHLMQLYTELIMGDY
jgi:hypothetical protein